MNLLVHVRTALDNTDDKLFVQLCTGMDSMAANFSLIGRNMENPEAQKPLERASIALRKVFTRPESFCAYDNNEF